jgi:transcriptional regulator with XRE-family HTH domain
MLEEMSNFSGWLKEQRKFAGLSQNALARAAGIDPAYVHQIENDNAGQVSRSVALSIGAALHLDYNTMEQLLWHAGLAPEINWQRRAMSAEATLESIRKITKEVHP